MHPERVQAITTTSGGSPSNVSAARLTTGKIVWDPVLINGACVEIYQRWRRHLNHEDSLEQARCFARRCANLGGLENEIAAIADEKAVP